MPNERLMAEVTGIQPARRELQASHASILSKSDIPVRESVGVRESVRVMEPTAEIIGKMSELSFQKHGGSDNSTMHQRG